MNLLNHKIFRVILFVIILNTDKILSLQTIGIVKLLIDILLGFILIYGLSASWLKMEMKGNSFFIKETFFSRLVFLILFLILINIGDIIECKMPNLLFTLVDLLLAILLVFFLVPSWKKYDIEKLKSE